MGVGAHALDELHGRPLQTRIRDATARRARRRLDRRRGGDRHRRRVACDARGCSPSSPSARFIVVAYNLELFGGRFHGDSGSRSRWGAFPVLTGVLRVGRDVRVEAVVAAAFAALAQPRAAAALDAGARSCGAGSTSVEGTIVLARRAGGAGDASTLTRGARGGAPRADARGRGSRRGPRFVLHAVR